MLSYNVHMFCSSYSDQYFIFFSEAKSKWLDAYHDPVASLYTFTQCITLSDIQADGDWKLIIADLGTGTFNMKLKVYKGNNVL